MLLHRHSAVAPRRQRPHSQQQQQQQSQQRRRPAQQQRRQQGRAAAWPAWAAQLLGRQQQDAAQQAADELLAVLTDSSSDGSGSSSGAKRARANALLDELLVPPSTPRAFDERLLGGGQWLVLLARGTPQLWRATFEAGRLFSPRSTASQALDPATRQVVNRAEYGFFAVEAAGMYEPQGAARELPCAVEARITSGALCVAGVRVPLPIRGTGLFEVVWLDGRLRVFRSGGAVSVQVKATLLDS